MKKVINYPCSRCQRLTNGTIIAYQYVSDDLTIVRFKKDCCGNEEVQFFNKLNLKHYVKEAQ